ncbi:MULTISPECIES: hypothetical protein [Streptomyces]|uniref:hypothetical protein n=1 Tax=Streptomyces lycopersici TaxID=2974589 RepID=UPI0021CE13A7|nr:hypothetical protein [Streptomyces sp. NEAU-383]
MKTWTGTRGAKDLDRTAQVGDVLWVVVDIETRGAPWEDAQLASAFTVTHWSKLWGKPMISGTVSAGDLVLKYGEVHAKQPKGLRDMAGPSPQVGGPLKGKPFGRKLDAAEIIDLEEQRIEALDRRAKGKSGKGRWF